MNETSQRLVLENAVMKQTFPNKQECYNPNKNVNTLVLFARVPFLGTKDILINSVIEKRKVFLDAINQQVSLMQHSLKLDVDPRRDDDASPMSTYRCMLRPT